MRKISFYLVMPVLFVFILFGCENESDKQPVNVEKSTELMQESGVRHNESSTLKSGNLSDNKSAAEDKLPEIKDQRMIIKTGSLSLDIEKYDDTETRILEIIKTHGGFVSKSNNTVNASGSKSGTITVKVPADKFDLLVAEISRIGKVVNQNIQASDVTEEYVDLESRLKTQKELEQRLLKLLDEKAVKLSDIIEVEEKLASVRQKIEGIEGKMKLLRSQSDLSTLTINVYEPSMLSTSSGGGFFYELKQAIKKGLSGFTKVLAVLIVFIISVIPVLLLAYVVYRIIKSILKRRKQNKSVKQ
ncbi:MAG: DUF4349 domain-containing protein [Candidatus Kapaibacterium sp.]